MPWPPALLVIVALAFTQLGCAVEVSTSSTTRAPAARQKSENALEKKGLKDQGGVIRPTPGIDPGILPARKKAVQWDV